MFDIVIPARYASQRFPGKMLAMLHGKPIIQHTYEQATKSDAERVIIATDDERIEKVVRQFTDDVYISEKVHPTGTDRIAEIVDAYDISSDRIVVNVQGDEPLIPPENINQVAKNLMLDNGCAMATLAWKESSEEAFHDPNVVKVVFNTKGRALYFSRALIPGAKAGHIFESFYRHIGLYAYRAGFLKTFCNLTPPAIELQESLEQLRALWHGHAIHVAEAIAKTPNGVDTPYDLSMLHKASIRD